MFSKFNILFWDNFMNVNDTLAVLLSGKQYYVVIVTFIIFIYLKVRETLWQDDEIFHPLLNSLIASNNWDWANLKPGDGNSIKFFHMGGRFPQIGAITCPLYEHKAGIWNKTRISIKAFWFVKQVPQTVS